MRITDQVDRLRDRHRIGAVIPAEEDRRLVHQVIYDELCRGVVRPESKAAYLDVIARAKLDSGIDGVILGCTEITLLIRQDDIDLPVFDTTFLHAESAMEFALG